MTRDELIIYLHRIGEAAYTQAYIEKVLAHDAEQRQVIEQALKDLSSRANLEGSAPCWNSSHMKQIAILRKALETIVEGEGLWTAHDMAHAAQQALKEHKP